MFAHFHIFFEHVSGVGFVRLNNSDKYATSNLISDPTKRAQMQQQEADLDEVEKKKQTPIQSVHARDLQKYTVAVQGDADLGQVSNTFPTHTHTRTYTHTYIHMHNLSAL